MAFLGAWLQLSLLLSFPQASETHASPAAKAKEFDVLFQRGLQSPTPENG